LKRLPPSTAAIVATIEPVVGTLVGIAVFGETIGFSSLAGMCLIIGAIFL
jgi:drug/metabolite transporter (DMT)-like permease